MSEKKSVYKVSGRRKYNYEFERIDLRRTWLVLGAIQNMETPTVTSIAKQLNFSKSTVQKVLKNLSGDQYPKLVISIENAVCSIECWGVINPEIIEEFYINYL